MIRYPSHTPNMFDDKKPSAPSAPVEDMFSATDANPRPAPVSPLLTPPPLPTSPITPPLPQASRHSGFGFIKVVLVVIIVLVLVAGAAYAAYRLMTRTDGTDNGIVDSVSDDGVISNEDERGKGKDDVTADDTTIEKPATDRGTFLDSDGDGLTNAEELEAGTSSNNPDTDSDGLGDREEVEVYSTDPRDADTDGDTYLDGQEVAGGYNPNGEGKLFNVPN